jgi:hypothetical protein
MAMRIWLNRFTFVVDIAGCMHCKSAKMFIMGFLLVLCRGGLQLYYKKPYLFAILAKVLMDEKQKAKIENFCST